MNVTVLWWRERAAIAKPHGDALSSFFRDTSLTAGRTETRRLSADVAVVRCRVTLSGQIAPTGIEPPSGFFLVQISPGESSRR